MQFNVTLVSVLVIVFLFIPGFFFKRFYFSGQFTKQFGAGVFAERVITSIFWGAVIQGISITVTSQIVNLSYNNIKVPISNFYSELCSNKIPDCSELNIRYAAVYILFTLCIACILGFACHKIVRLLKIDIKFPIFRFANYWNYYFKGDLLSSTKGFNGRRGKVISTEIDIISEDGKGTNKLYSGFLYDYTISPTSGDLETITLTNALRWSETTKAFKPIPGDLLIIPYKKVVNFNMRYNVRLNSGTWFSKLVTIASLIAMIALLSIVVITPYLYYNKIGLAKTILLIFLLLLDWLFILAMVTNLFTKTPPKGSNPNTVSPATKGATTFFFVILIGLITFFVTKIIS